MNGWSRQKLGDVCEIVTGQSPPGVSYNTVRVGLPFYQGKKEFGPRQIGAPKTWTTVPTKIAEAGDVLMSVRAPVGPVNFLSERACIGRGLAAIRASEHVDREFLFYNLLMRESEIAGKEGAVFASISRTEIAGLDITLPSVEEQRRIVRLLDQAFVAIATATANTKRNLSNVRDWFEAELSNCFAGLPFEQTLGSIASLVRGPFGGSLKKEIFQPQGFAVYEQQHAIYDQFENIRYYVSEDKFRAMKRFEVRPGQLIMSCSGTIGRVALVPAELHRGIINQALLKIAPSKACSGEYLLWYMRSAVFRTKIAQHSGGAALQNVSSVAVLKNIEVPLPEKSEQEARVERIQKLLTTAKRLEGLYENKLESLARLRQSLLHRAFSGELIEREPLAA